ncbi:SPOR domain-containing protein [Marinomonas algarum]|uniref:SPOR domain-containing protein n=1 Tax=Marinomonas algarum TaxID=2883105 RepID=A0A9X1IKA4_9GAMM|nr:SPOR domain-containing protein [Marinomonas algarum]MCB5160412.1 SPOR domain-containing protein [Marinomonas algarum]
MLDKTMRYRLIGAGIMVLSAATVLPLILDGERPAELDINVQVTSPPDFPVIDIQPVQPAGSMASADSASGTPTTEDIQLIPVPKPAKDVSKIVSSSSSVATPKVASVPTKSSSSASQSSEPIAERWTLQIATFKSKDNTVRLVEKLKKANYDAYSMTTNSLYKVYVGPEFKRSVSEKKREEIKDKFKLNGIVIRYSVN